MCSDAPNNDGINKAAEANAEVAKEALEFYKQVYAEQAPLREQASATAKQVSDAQLASMQQQDSISRDYWNYQKDTFRPLEQRLVEEASSYDTAERREAEAGQAVADVGQQAALARQAQARTQQRMGVNPNSGASASMQNLLSLNEAAAKAGGANAARKQVETVGRAMKMDAASLGRNLPANQATSASLGIAAGNSAATTAQMPMQQAASHAATMGQGFQTATGANSATGNLYAQANGNQSDNSGAVWGALGTVAGAAIMASDENGKKHKKPVSDEAALEAIEKTPVASWTYKEGVGDGGSHVGPMAQQVNKVMGEQAAPGGKQIDLITMNGVTMAGVAALSRKVKKLEQQIEGAAA